MMQRFYTFLGLLLVGQFAFAQTDFRPEHACGSHQGRSKWLQQYQLNPDAYRKGGDTTIYVAMTIHLVGTDSGAGYFSENSMLNAFCKLNEMYAPTGIQFFIAGDILYHNNSAWYDHDTVLEGAEMMFQNNVPNTLNTYFVSDPAGNCGYNLPYAGIANSIGCSDANDVTWAHEVGHALSLPHPFLGWEGGVSWDGSIDHNFNDPAPDRVTYNYTFFQDTLILDTLIIDTTFVERTDGSNCTFAADGFCDTQPDYLASRWSCNGNGVSPVTQRDPANVPFQSDGSLIMNYANDACQARFSPQQLAAMRAFLYDRRSSWISNAPPLPPVSDTPVATFPENGADVNTITPTLAWEPVINATGYVVQVSRLVSFPPSLTENYLTANNNITLDNLLADRTYYWRIRAFNNYGTCGSFSSQQNFTPRNMVNTNDIPTLSRWSAAPQPVRTGEPLLLQCDMLAPWSGQLLVINAMGQIISSSNLQLQTGSNTHHIDTANLPTGVYSLQLTDGQTMRVMRVVVQ